MDTNESLNSPLEQLNFDIDPEAKKAILKVFASLEVLLKADERDKLLENYRIRQAKNQYEFILLITAAEHEAKLVNLKAQLEAQKKQLNAAYKVQAALRVTALIANFQSKASDIMFGVFINMDEKIKLLDRIDDLQLRALARAFLNKHCHDCCKQLSDLSLESIEAIKNVLK